MNISIGRKQAVVTPFRVAAIFVLILGLYVTFLRFWGGLGRVTNLSDTFPWGIWIAFDVLCGVALAAGGFTMTAMAYIMGIDRYRSIVRPSVLTAFLGYLLVVAGLMFDLGRPWQIWHPVVMWNPHSVMFEVAWCVMLYTIVLAIEFSPIVFEKFGWYRPTRLYESISIVFVMLGVLLSTLHQSSLGSLFLIIPEKVHPLWWSQLLPVLFFVSAIMAGFAMVIFESYMSSRAFKQSLERYLVVDLSRFLFITLILFLAIRIQDLISRGALGYLFVNKMETYFFWIEQLLFIIPIYALSRPERRINERAIFWSATSVVIGLVVNRFNVSITAVIAMSGIEYYPSVYEVFTSLFLITFGVVIFWLAAKYLPIFRHGKQLSMAKG
ncbi:MAG: NrfD/PsrC family molybdoenzyme membrane anchor subunit [Candidatus Glassbacteria bacterium]